MKESELVNKINIFYKNEGMVYTNEVRMGIGIPDILLSYEIVKDINIITDYYELELYYFMYSKRIRRIDTLLKKYRYSKEHTKKYLKVLESKEIIGIKDNKVHIKERIDKKKLGINISIEAKLKDWRNALLQAERYLEFSDYSYVALPSNVIEKVDKEIFKEKGIGLLSVDDVVLEIIKAKKSRKCSYILKYIAMSHLSADNL